ncbi:UDP-N-acetylmuramate dehydrogenase [Ascidiimonas aurantiaca]|uniref:UDP-N-acetylmuramate dehydrogenase n=1 Tax=Ascidiimonas aurantiaca TaxID=1685432 RepID=UPI0030EC6545
MNIQKKISLKPYNTFGIDVKARYFVEVNTVDDLIRVLQLPGYPKKFILGGGSNLLLTKDLDALVIHLNIKGKKINKENTHHVLVQVYAGENWHDFVLWTLAQDYGGLENLSLIPGNTGAAPIQNIGAYGVELKNVFHSCEAVHIHTGEKQEYNLEDCKFGYRDSIFKNALKNKVVVTSMTVKLSKNKHILNTNYGAIESKLHELGITNPDIRDVSKAVIAIRQSKLPDPQILGNSGSFFKNPVIEKSHFEALQVKHPKIPGYPTANTSKIKVPAGWLIEQCGLKGKRFGDAGVHEKQALVLVNHANATGKEILTLANHIQKVVKQQFQIAIEPEVNIM